MPSPDALVLGAGPAGLAAGLALARAGARVEVAEGADAVGGLCRTVTRAGVRCDLGGHILFVRTPGRRAWLEDLLGDGLVWVDRPVARVEDGRVVPGRYLDRRPPGFVPPAPPDTLPASGAEYLAERMGGAAWVDVAARRYLEKIDGLPLERIPAARVDRLLVGQAAPDGFWFCRHGIGALMGAMADAITSAGGRVLTATPVESVRVRDGALGAVTLAGRHAGTRTPGALVVGVPALAAARLLRPPPDEPLPDVPMRAVCLVYLALDRDRLTDEPWIQVDDPAVPFARLAEARNWSPDLAPPGRTVVCCEVYCRATPHDPSWALGDAELAARCAAALRSLGLLDDPAAAVPAGVVRMPRAYPMPPLEDLHLAQGPHRALAAVRGVAVAQGGAVIEAVDAGEAAARAALAAVA